MSLAQSPYDSFQTRCKNAKCRKALIRNRLGRPKEYCDKRCRDAAYRAHQAAPSAEAARYTAYVRALSESLARSADALLNAASTEGAGEESSLRVLHWCAEIERRTHDVQAAAVGLARTQRVPAAGIARAMSVTPAKLRTTWPADVVERRMHRNVGVPSEAVPSAGERAADRERAGDLLPRPRRAGARRGDPRDGEERPPGGLSLALATLHRSSGRTLRDLGRAVGVSASYLSRVLAGKRCPSWRLAQSLAEECGGDPDDIRPLWE
ncbi:helix-turn-helix transcriptional regulator, partial [Streptomyces sp. DSM 44917]